MSEPISLENMWFVISFGLLATLPYVVARAGLVKSWYILEPLPGLLGGSMVYGSAAWGLAFVAMVLTERLPARSLSARNWRGLSALMSFGLLGFVLTVWQPSWLKPRWVRWLEYEYGYCLDIMIAEARKMGRWVWEEQVRTRAGMEHWAQDVVSMHRKEIDERWEIERDYRLAPKTTAALARGRFELEDDVVPDVPQHRRAQEEARLKQIEEEMRQFQQEQ